MEFLAGGLELFSELEEVVDLAIVDDDMAPVGGCHRLVSARTRIDDGKAAMAQRDMALRAEPVARTIGSAMRNLIREIADFGLFDGPAAEINDPGNSTHDDANCSGETGDIARRRFARPKPAVVNQA